MEVIGLFISTFLLIISGLLAWIGNMNRNANNTIIVRMDRQDLRIEKHDEEIKELALQSREALTVIKHKLKIK